MDSIFYLVWRNCFIRAEIRNKVCQDIVIKINSLIELQNNHQYLSLFTDRDKLNNNIYIRLKINNHDQFNQYISNSQYNHVVNDLKLDYPTNGLDLDKGVIVQRLSFYLNSESDSGGDGGGRLPQSLTELIVKPWEHGVMNNFNNTALDNMLLNHLPTSLRKLKLPNSYHIKTTIKMIKLPDTLEDLHYETWNISNLKKLIMPPNRIYTNCKAYVNFLDDLQWAQSQPWIGNLYMDHRTTLNLTSGMIPPQIKELYFYHNGTVEDQNIFPQNLIKLLYRSRVEINRLVLVPQLKQLIYLDVNNFDQQLDKSMLPSTLETLIMDEYNSPLLPDVLPNSLTELKLQSFNQELNPFVLPSHLKILELLRFTGDIVANALPCTLTRLALHSITGSFQHAPQMNHLSYLNIKVLHPSVSRVISNTNKIRIAITQSIDPCFNIQQTSIQHLDWAIISNRIPLTSNLVPNQIKTLNLYRFSIVSKVIPTSCTKLVTDTNDFNLNLIPSSTKYICTSDKWNQIRIK